MASNADTKEEKIMASDLVASGADEPRDERPPERPAARRAGAGYFSIYKKGQGYWTRMGTAIGAGVLGILIVWHIYRYIPAFPAFRSATDPARAQRIGLIAAAVFAAVYGAIAWRLMNKPANADFLIATDGEMKKVNWTSRRELIGSTKVVIVFMFAIAAILFVLDLIFNTIFYSIRVLEVPWWKQVFGGGGE